jgi:hypothetical protein
MTQQVKQDVASALCRLSTQIDVYPLLAVHALELVEALFWLSLEDLLALTKSVLLRVSINDCYVFS